MQHSVTCRVACGMTWHTVSAMVRGSPATCTVLTCTGVEEPKRNLHWRVCRGRDGTEVKPYVAPTREGQIKALKEEVFDVLVIGGGCVGSGGELSWFAC